MPIFFGTKVIIQFTVCYIWTVFQVLHSVNISNVHPNKVCLIWKWKLHQKDSGFNIISPLFLSYSPELGLQTEGLIPLKQDSRWLVPRCQWARAWLEIKHWSCDALETLANLRIYIILLTCSFQISWRAREMLSSLSLPKDT